MLSGDDDDDDDKMEFDDQEILGDAASVDEPSSHDLPSPPFPIKDMQKDPQKSVSSLASPTATNQSLPSPRQSSQHSNLSSPSRGSSSGGGGGASPSNPPVTLSGSFKEADAEAKTAELDEQKMETGDDNASSIESPTHYLPPKHLLTANRCDRFYNCSVTVQHGFHVPH